MKTHYIGDVAVNKLMGTSGKIINDDELKIIVKRLNRLPVKGWPVGAESELFGMGRRLLHLRAYSIKDEFGSSIIYRDTNDFRKDPNRLPIEIAAYRIWKDFDDNKIDRENIFAVAQLSVSEAAYRNKISTTRIFVSGHKIEYLKPNLIQDRLDSLFITIYNSKIMSFENIAMLFLDFLCIHPFIDGNGRVARLLLQVLIHRYYGLEKPLLPISPIISANRRILMNCLFACYFDSNAIPFINFTYSALLEAGKCMEQILN